jgi:hypothetical protein
LIIINSSYILAMIKSSTFSSNFVESLWLVKTNSYLIGMDF